MTRRTRNVHYHGGLPSEDCETCHRMARVRVCLQFQASSVFEKSDLQVRFVLSSGDYAFTYHVCERVTMMWLVVGEPDLAEHGAVMALNAVRWRC